jgi:hypothetical protein
MCQPLFVAIFFVAFLHSIASGKVEPTISFVDGRWSGEVETGPNGRKVEECWAHSTSGDGTALALAKQSDGSWYLRLSNPGWRLPTSSRYPMIALVDFYPHVRVAAEVKSQTRLEIANIEQQSLLSYIENGHTIDLMSGDFSAKYDLEGSAKVIEKIRNCFAH